MYGLQPRGAQGFVTQKTGDLRQRFWMRGHRPSRSI
jgi:hypothetical protein